FVRRKEVEILGEVHSPGVFPYFDGMRVSDLLYSGGNLTEEAYLKSAELTRFSVVDGTWRELERLEISLDDILAGNSDADLALQAHDNLLVRRLSNWRGAERVRVTGELTFPGLYPIEEGERLSDLLERAGGFLPDAYLSAAVFTRESVREIQQEQLERMSERLEKDLARYGLSTKSLDSEKDVRLKEVALAGKQLAEELRETRASGRLVIRLEDVEELQGSEFDLLLQNGDHLHVPKRNEFVLVLGEVNNPATFRFRSNWSRKDYIRQAGGTTRFADKRNIYVIRADGSVAPSRYDLSFGDVIVVPENVERFSGYELALSTSQILYHLSMVTATISSIGLFQ
ncbi:MAG: SLBB domain-containing protein, partial [Candidatus Krumholzibacteria bacterium]|nr:SLBB domain-containing protein [Candidatus Krumholzibacteria bacterium]